MKRFIGFVIFLVVAALPISSFSQDQVSGSFVVKGKTTPFNYVYAYWNAQFMDPAVQDLYVLLTDVPVTKEHLPTNDERVSKIVELGVDRTGELQGEGAAEEVTDARRPHVL